MKRIMIWIMAIMVLFVPMLTTACGGSGGNGITAPPIQASLNGTWNGSYTYVSQGQTWSIPITMTLTDNNGTVTGTGYFASGASAIVESFSGTRSTTGAVSLIIHDNTNEDAIFTGTLNGNAMIGVLNGSGFINDAITFTRS